MAISYPADMEILGAELQGLRTLEVPWEYNTKVDGSTYVRDKLNTEYANSSAPPDDAELASKTSLNENVVQQLADVHEARKADVEAYLLKEYLGHDKLGLSGDELEEGPIVYDYDQDLIAETGQVTILRRRGIFGRLRQDMIDNSQTIRLNGVSLGAIAAATGNAGVVAEASVTSMDHTLAGTFEIECVDGTVGNTRFSVKLILTNPLVDGTTEIEADNQIALGQSFEDGQTGLGITLSLGSITESGDGGAIFSSWTVTTPAASDSNRGRHYITVERVSGSADFRIYWFNNDDRDEETDLVAIANVAGVAGNTTVTMTGAGGTVISVTMDRTAAAAALAAVGNTDADIYIDIENPREGDRWTKTVTNDEAGIIATKIARRWRASLSSVANPGQTITDTIASSLSMA